MVPKSNKHLTFKGAKVHEVPTDRGDTVVVLDLQFESFRERFFDPGKDKKFWMKSWKYMAHLCDVLGVDITQIPKVYSWIDMAEKFVSILEDVDRTPLFVKITKNKENYNCLGEIPCFSREPDLAYTEADRAYYVPMTENDIDIMNLPQSEL